jgi:hypothetical protein
MPLGMPYLLPFQTRLWVPSVEFQPRLFSQPGFVHRAGGARVYHPEKTKAGGNREGTWLSVSHR